MVKKFLVLIFSITVLTVASQSKYNIADHYNGWFMYFGDHKFTPKLGIRLEAQWRRSNVVVDPQQLLLRTGLNYHFNKNVFATAGYCFVNTHPYGEFPAAKTFPEQRFWQQLQAKHFVGAFEMVHRFRLEQRFVNQPYVYSNRFRYCYRVSVPFNGKEISDNSFYITAYDEVMVGFGENIRYAFDQNRVYMALGYKVPKLGRFEIGYLNQLILKSDGIRVENNHTLQVSLTSNFDLYKKD
jgi:hypothetical protein